MEEGYLISAYAMSVLFLQDSCVLMTCDVALKSRGMVWVDLDRDDGAHGPRL